MTETNSIWTSPQPPHKTTGSRLEAALNHLRSFAPRRSRAGTLPTKLPSLFDHKESPQEEQGDESEHHGSLALVSPDDNDILPDIPENQRSAVGQAVGTSLLSSSPNSGYIMNPVSSSGTNVSTHSASNSMGGSINQPLFASSPGHPYNSLEGTPANSHGTSQRNSLQYNRDEEGERIRTISNPLSENDPFDQFPSLQNIHTRTRSGSVNSMTSIASQSSFPQRFSPYSSSIWSQNSIGSSLQPVVPFPQKTGASMEDQMPHRLRSLTIQEGATNTTTPIPRPRAQTLLSNGPAQVADPPTITFSETPTQSLWITNIPPQATPSSLQALFSNFAALESAIVDPARRCAYLTFPAVSQAVEAQAATNGTELYVGQGLCTVTFAQMKQQVNVSQTAPLSIAYVLQSLNASSSEISAGIAHMQRSTSMTFSAPIHPLSEILPNQPERTYTPPVLRDIRRRLETMPQQEVEDIALDMMEELPHLASDYIGNTVVQLVYERGGILIRDMMLRKLVPVFAATGTHKNGTWAVQKMIDLATEYRHFALIEEALRNHLVPLLLDQFGNYVVQGCLKFPAPFSNFVYTGIASSLPNVAPNRFGARAVRAVLESEHTPTSAQRLVATAIVQQAAFLAHDPNGCLLVSWLLDSFGKTDGPTHARTHALICNQLIPQHMLSLCSSKLGSGIVLRLAGSDSGGHVLECLLQPATDRVPPILESVLAEPSGQGSTFVYKLLTNVLPANSLERQVCVNKVRLCLLKNGAGMHRKLLEEVGLSLLLPPE